MRYLIVLMMLAVAGCGSTVSPECTQEQYYELNSWPIISPHLRRAAIEIMADNICRQDEFHRFVEIVLATSPPDAPIPNVDHKGEAIGKYGRNGNALKRAMGN